MVASVEGTTTVLIGMSKEIIKPDWSAIIRIHLLRSICTLMFSVLNVSRPPKAICIQCSFHSSFWNRPSLPRADLSILVRFCLTSSSSDSVPQISPPEFDAEKGVSRPQTTDLLQLQQPSQEVIPDDEPKEVRLDDLLQGLHRLWRSSLDYSKCIWYEDEGYCHTIGVINTSPDSKWCHIS